MSQRWPKTMLKKTALEYCELSEVAFDKEISGGRLPEGFMLGGKRHWHKDALDKALVRIAGGETETSKAKERFWKSGQAA
jgi:hypothetical protein